jgi:hypothetical protein
MAKAKKEVNFGILAERVADVSSKLDMVARAAGYDLTGSYFSSTDGGEYVTMMLIDKDGHTVAEAMIPTSEVVE